jgi:hypothetical protein
MQTGIHIHLDDAIINGGLDLLPGRAGATMEDKEAEKYQVW